MRMKHLMAVVLACALPMAAQAQSILLDTEAMDYLKGLAKPLLVQAQIPAENVDVFVVDDMQVNAFVTPEKRIYFYTGLIDKADNGNQLQGVLAHEIGHIKGHHYLKSLAMQDKLKWPVLIGAIIGTGAMAAAGAGDVGQAILTGGMAASASNVLSFSRGQEQQADQIGLQLLKKIDVSALGLAQFFSKLQLESTLFANAPPAYLLTHPMPSARLDFIRQYLPGDAAAATPTPPTPDFVRVKAKILALVNTPGQTLRKYMQDTSDTALYAKCIAYALQGKKKESMSFINKLLQKSPDDFFYKELKAQLLVDHGDIKEAIDIYSQITTQRPDLPLVQLQYADALVAGDRAADSLPYYNRALRAFPDWASVHHRLGVAYGKAGELAASHISLTQEAILEKELDEAQLHLNTAKQYLDKANEATKQRFDILKDELAEAKEE